MADMDTTEQQQAEAVAAPANGQLSAEEKELKEKEWKEELAKTEEEVDTLKKVLASKQKRVTDLKRMLGIGIVSKLSKDMNDGISRLSESEMMMKANSALKTAGERTSAAFSTVGKKLEDVKEIAKEKAGGAYNSVKAKVAAKTDASGAPAAGAEATEDPMNTQSVENPQ